MKDQSTLVVFEGLSDLTLDTLEKLKGHTTVSRQFIADLAKASHIKEAERKLINQVLNRHTEHRISVHQFANEVSQELLPIATKIMLPDGEVKEYTGNWHSNAVLPSPVRGRVYKYAEHVYQSPIKTNAGSIHYSSNSVPNYFAHCRIEDMNALPEDLFTLKVLRTKLQYVLKSTDADVQTERKKWRKEVTGIWQRIKADRGIRRIIELQSDLFQKGRFEKTPGEEHTALAVESLDEAIEGIKALAEKLKKAGLDHVAEAEQRSIQSLLEEREKRLSRVRDAETGYMLEPYLNIWHDRVIGEELRQAAKDKKSRLQIPTGETAMKVERIGDYTKTCWHDWQGNEIAAKDLKPGMIVYQNSREHAVMVTELLASGSFQAIPRTYVSELIERLNIDPDELARIVKDCSKNLEITYDPTTRINQSHPIYRFYESELGKYLQSTYNANRVIDKQGISWWEVEVKPEMANEPVMAFGKRIPPGKQPQVALPQPSKEDKELETLDQLRTQSSRDDKECER